MLHTIPKQIIIIKDLNTNRQISSDHGVTINCRVMYLNISSSSLQRGYFLNIDAKTVATVVSVD